MDKFSWLSFLSVSWVLLSLGCNQPFDAAGPVDPHLAVFTILSTDRNTQFVRVTAPFLAAGFDPASGLRYDNSVADATVDIFTAPSFDPRRPWSPVAGQQLHLRDTLLAMPDAVASSPPLHIFAITPFTPAYGVTYSVYASSRERGVVWGSVRLPGKPTIYIPWGSIEVMNGPKSFDPNTSIEFLVTLADSGGGYLARLYLDYSVVQENEWISERVEVPVSSADPSTFHLVSPAYPGLVAAGNSARKGVEFKNGFLQSVIKRLVDSTYAGSRIVFDRLTLILLQADQNLYSYYAAAQLENDPRSIRLDQPSIAKLNGEGYGLIGGYTLDSATYLLPEYFYANHR
jgi:hypothetical protein